MSSLNQTIERLKRRVETLRSHHQKCERASTHVKTPESDPPDSTVSSPHQEASDIQTSCSDDDEYKPPGSPSSNSSCSNVSNCSSLSLSELSDGEDHREETILEQPSIKQPRKMHVKKCPDELDGADGAREETLLEQPSIKAHVKKRPDETELSDGDETGGQKPAKKKRVNKCTDDAQKNKKKPWSEEEKHAVEKRSLHVVHNTGVPYT